MIENVSTYTAPGRLTVRFVFPGHAEIRDAIEARLANFLRYQPDLELHTSGWQPIKGDTRQQVRLVFSVSGPAMGHEVVLLPQVVAAIQGRTSQTILARMLWPLDMA